MPNQVNNGTTKLYYLPDDKTHTPLSHDDYIEAMREAWRIRKRMQRNGECNAPRKHPCSADCCDCPYRTRKASVSLDAIIEEGSEPASSDDVAERVIRKIMLEQIEDVIPQLDTIDRIIIKAKIARDKPLTDRQCAEIISRRTGMPYTHQAVSKRLPKAIEHLRELVGATEDD